MRRRQPLPARVADYAKTVSVLPAVASRTSPQDRSSLLATLISSERIVAPAVRPTAVEVAAGDELVGVAGVDVVVYRCRPLDRILRQQCPGGVVGGGVGE